MTTSPGGSTFPYYYRGGEIHCLKYGSHFDDEEKLFRLMEAERDFILKKPNLHVRVWTDFYETAITANVLLRFVENIAQMHDRILKLAVVGLSKANQYKLMRLVKKSASDFAPCRFFMDPEEAKTWLVSE